MPVTRAAIVVGVLLFGAVCWAAAAGSSAAFELLISVVVLVGLVAGGNWLGARRTPDVPRRGSASPPSSTYGPADPGEPPPGPTRP